MPGTSVYAFPTTTDRHCITHYLAQNYRATGVGRHGGGSVLLNQPARLRRLARPFNGRDSVCILLPVPSLPNLPTALTGAVNVYAILYYPGALRYYGDILPWEE